MNPSFQVRLSIIFKTRAHVTEPMMDRRICNGPSSGSHCVINEHTRPDPVGGNFKNWQLLRTPPLHFTHFLPYFSHFPPFSTSYLSSLSTNHFPNSPNPQIPKIYPLLVEVCCCGSVLANKCLTCLSPVLRYVSLISTHLHCIFVFFNSN